MQKERLLPQEIQLRVKNGYVERLGVRVKQMRKEWVNRDWPGLTRNCSHLKKSSKNLGFDDLSELAERLENIIASQSPAGKKLKSISKPLGHFEIKTSAEKLFRKIDLIVLNKEQSTRT